MNAGTNGVHSSATQEDKAVAYLDPRLFCNRCIDFKAICNCYLCKKPSQALATLKRFTLFFSLQFLNYSLLCWNMRAVAFGWVGNVVVSDLLIAALSFTLIKKVAEAKDKTAMWGYIAGGAVGSAASVLVTNYLWRSL